MKKQLFIACLVACFAGQAQNTLSERDQKFATCAAEAGLKEVKLGELAVSKATTPQVKMLGQHMIDDHTTANKELTALAAKKGMSLPTMLSSKDQEAYDALAKKQGVAFDKAYAKCMVKDHKKVICKFKKEAKKGDDPELKSYARNTVPTLEHHKEMSKAARK